MLRSREISEAITGVRFLNHKSSVGYFVAIACALCAQAVCAAAESDAVSRKNAHDIFKQLIEINTTDSVGSTTVAAQAMAQRLLEAGFPKRMSSCSAPMTARAIWLRDIEQARIGTQNHSDHRTLDVVEAQRQDWTTDPFQFIEKDGYFYGRGTQDMKDSDAIAVTDFIRMKKEGFVPDRDNHLGADGGRRGRQVERRGVAAEESPRPDRCRIRVEPGCRRGQAGQASQLSASRQPRSSTLTIKYWRPIPAAIVRCRPRTTRFTTLPMRSRCCESRRSRSS